MRPMLAVLGAHYPKTHSRAELYESIGWNDLINNPAYKDTCAVRMSVGLLRCGVHLPGARMKAHAGTIKGKFIEPGHGKLSMILKRLWGEPEVFRSEKDAQAEIGNRGGVISFFRIYGGPQDGGHIDLVWPSMTPFHGCSRSCFFSAWEIWFWPLG